MKIRKVLLPALLATASLGFALEAGDICFTKKQATPVLASPDRSAEVVSKADWGTQFTATAIDGRWVKVKRGNVSGWIFSGNLSPDKPPVENKTDFLPTAGDTGAAVAARPLSSTAKDYASRTSHGEAVADIEWLEKFAAGISSADVTAYQKENARGEYAK